MRVLFIEPYPIEGPSSRYRIEQYVPYFTDNGIKCTVRPFISSKFYKILYKRGHYLKKISFFIQSSVKRFFDLFTALNSDIVFIHLEAFPFGYPIFEWILTVFKKRLIYDLDDAIYLGKTSPVNIFLKYLKWPSKVKEIIKISRYVITCNEFLANYARKFNPNVIAIHTSIDTDRFTLRSKNTSKNVTIGWIGSHTTAPYLREIEDVFLQLGKKYKFNLKIIGAGKYNIRADNISVISMDWRLEDEVEQFQSLDIGVYPLPDSEWTFGKTGFKAIQYMSVGVPCVASRIGANRDIIEDNLNGFLVGTKDEWVQRLSNLIEDAELREKTGLLSRKTVEEKYSVKVNAPKILEIIQKVYSENHDRKMG